MSNTKNALDTIYNVVMEAFETHKRAAFYEVGKFQANAMSFDEVLRGLKKSVSVTLQTAWSPNEEAKSHIAKIQENLAKVLNDWLANATALKNRGAALNPTSTHVYEMLRNDLEIAFKVI
ncbi:MAG: hypothetical protein HYT12_03030 [Candidatus Liptonbacteria bacterium]|nr:hypothetical protein [Candidatus Liptonbacteria bacterium]